MLASPAPSGSVRVDALLAAPLRSASPRRATTALPATDADTPLGTPSALNAVEPPPTTAASASTVVVAAVADATSSPPDPASAAPTASSVIANANANA
jgi:hypothetical protein